MTDSESASFLEQIDEAKRAVESWPHWIQESTCVVTAAIPAALASKAAAANVEAVPALTSAPFKPNA